MDDSIPLSPATQAVLDAYMHTPFRPGLRTPLAAALRAAALYCSRDRRILMTIADELDSLDS